MFSLSYHEEVVKTDLPKIDSNWKGNIKKSIETKLTSRPEVYGKPLRQSLKNNYKLRVGDYRVIFRIENNNVKIFAIQHRSVVYKKLNKRFK
ncbi:MAG: type II toxin-antitoxin system RelE family toxin [Candidatus Saccharimonadales bacterium]